MCRHAEERCWLAKRRRVNNLKGFHQCLFRIDRAQLNSYDKVLSSEVPGDAAFIQPVWNPRMGHRMKARDGVPSVYTGYINTHPGNGIHVMSGLQSPQSTCRNFCT